MKKPRVQYVCQECGADSPKWLGRCPGCGAWGSMAERAVVAESAKSARPRERSTAPPVRLADVSEENVRRFSTGSAEFDRVLGGGVIPGGLFLVGGDPGIGKSTLLLQTAHRVADRGASVLYVTGEESPGQVKMRAGRLGAASGAGNVYVAAETDLSEIETHVGQLNPILLIIDSIQTVFRPDLPAAPGSVQQVRECTMTLLRIAKERRIATCIVGHVTRDGTIAGPRLMEHMVDAVLYFEGERHDRFRILRGVKNRFGSTNEIGVFDMRQEGLSDVVNPSELFISERSAGAPGSVIVASLEGSRPVLAEVQALVASTVFGTPRRTASGLDYNRVNLLMAVLEKRAGVPLGHYDAYVNVAGGLRLEEPAIDLGIALALASSHRDKALSPGIVVVGEVGLTGEVRAVARLDERLREARKLGFERIIAPAGSASGLRKEGRGEGTDVVGVATLREAIRAALP